MQNKYRLHFCFVAVGREMFANLHPSPPHTPCQRFTRVFQGPSFTASSPPWFGLGDGRRFTRADSVLVRRVDRLSSILIPQERAQRHRDVRPLCKATHSRWQSQKWTRQEASLLFNPMVYTLCQMLAFLQSCQEQILETP